ncbi:4-hydroxy-tetrahydrodipicolinate reductase [Buchnera aphidicola (Ceratoglyphina bambusae)]|uniref:4-hydroxy-tetrahydrodipicolinate reductase n=1 Tax=Buchnera aphidicola TaxID=9 RepID=UPI0031B82BFF
MKNKKIKLAISGANGRMGKIIIKEIKKRNDLTIGLLLIKKNKHKNIKIKKIKNFIPTKYSLKNQNNKFDILIDFSEKKNTIKNIKYCIKHKKNIIIGTTGFNETQEKFIKNSSKKICIVKSANFSKGINLIHLILKNIVNKLKNLKIKIVEEHHKNKKDSPSGTAIEIGKTIKKKLSINKKINFISKRIGNTIGKHKIIFSNKYEKIEIKHKAKNRSIFALGAIKSAKWSYKRTNGLFNMKNVINK